MTREEIIAELETMDRNNDPISCHMEADELLCKFHTTMGYKDVADAFDKAKDRVGFFYA